MERPDIWMCIRYLRGSLRLGSGGSLRTAINIHTELSTREPFPLFGAFASRVGEASLFFLPPQGDNCFPPLPHHQWWEGSGFQRLRTSRPKRPCDMGHLSPLGLLLQRLIGRRDQHLCQERDDWFFG